MCSRFCIHYSRKDIYIAPKILKGLSCNTNYFNYLWGFIMCGNNASSDDPVNISIERNLTIIIFVHELVSSQLSFQIFFR